MTFRQHLLVLGSGVLMASCVMAPGDQQPSVSGAGAAAKNHQPAHTVTGGSGIQSSAIPWELSCEPYAYRDIRPGTRPKSDSVEGGLWFAVDKAEKQQKTAGNRIIDSELQTYLHGITCKLSGPYCPDIRTYVMQVPQFNATMAPNGTMSIWSGFLLRVRNEAQIAAVIGHEIGHYIRRHSVQRYEDVIAKTDALIFVKIGLAMAGVPAGIGTIADLIAAGSIKAYGRDHERESDLIGITLMSQHGYDTREAAKIWDQIIREFDPKRQGRQKSLFLASHPPDDERQDNLKRMSDRLQGAGKWGETGEERFQKVFAPWRKQFLEDEVRLGRVKSTLALFEMLYEDGRNRAEIRFFEGEVYRRRGKSEKEKKEGEWTTVWTDENENEAETQAVHEQEDDLRDDFTLALEKYDAAFKEGTPPPQIHRSLGLIHHRKGDMALARKHFATYLELLPNAPDRKVISFMLKPTSEVPLDL